MHIKMQEHGSSAGVVAGLQGTPWTMLAAHQNNLCLQLGPQTFFQAVNIIDRYLEAKVVPRKKFQLVRACRLGLKS